jgi:hypothetical protein
MKVLQKLGLIAGILLTGGYVSAQTAETISMGSGYANDIYYSVENGVVKTEANGNWDVAFTTDFFDASVIVNHAKGIEVFVASDNASDWETIDTVGVFANPVYNSTESWSVGAFNQNGTGQFNFGWGNYNTVTHNVSGSRIFILRYQDGSLKKMIIDDMLTNGEWNFRIADLDGSNLIDETLNKTGNGDKYFMYYDIATETTVDREPVKGAWDMIFTKYYSEIIPGAYYSVTGVLTAPEVQVAERANIPVASDDYSGLVFETFLDEIGYDWKSFNMSTFQFELTDSLVYFVQQGDFEVYKIYFTGFEGSSTGNIDINRSAVLNLGLIESQFEVNAFPNPTVDYLNIEGENLHGSSIRVLDMAGRVVYRGSAAANSIRLSTAEWNSGMYTVELQSEKGVAVFRVQKN